jgi:hypothetical protein
MDIAVSLWLNIWQLISYYLIRSRFQASYLIELDVDCICTVEINFER